MKMIRRFPAPWTYEQTPGGFVVKDAAGQKLAYLYCRDEKEGREVAGVLTWDESRLIAANVAKLPDLRDKE